MAKKKADKALMDKPQPKATRLNRNVIILISAVVLIAVIMIFVQALSQPQHVRRAGSAKIEQQGQGIDKNTAKIKQLPDSYADAAQINKLLGRDQKPQVVTKIPDALRQQIEQLQQTQAALESKIAELKQKPASSGEDYSRQDQQAMTSAIFIAGGAPRPQTQAEVKKDEKKKLASSTSGSAAKASDYDQQNMQAEKSAFLDSKPEKDIYDKHHVQFPASKFIIQAGGVIPAVLQSTIVSNLPGLITAVVRQNVYDTINGNYLLIPKGSRLIGEYNSKVSYGQAQLQAVFTRLVRPDGSSIVLPGKSAGTNSMGVSGFEDSVDNHWGRVFGAAALITLFNIPAIIAQNQQNQGVGYVPVSGTGGGYTLKSNTQTAALQSVGQAVSQIGNNIAQKSLNIQPTITINSGYQFAVMVNKDIILPPYHQQFENIPELAG